MLPAVLDTRTRSINELGTTDRLRGNTLLHPLHHRHEHVILGRVSVISVITVADTVGAVAAMAVSHTTDLEETVEFIQVARSLVHGLCHPAVVQLGVVGTDHLVLEPVVGEDLAACVAEGRDVSVPGLDVVWVLLQGGLGVLDIPVRGVVVGVAVGHVAQPVLAVLEWLPGVHNTAGKNFGSWLHAGVQEFAVCTVQRRKRLANGVCLGTRDALVIVGVGFADNSFESGMADIGVLDDSVLCAIETVTLPEDLLVDDLPQRRRQIRV